MNERERIIRLWFDMWLRCEDLGIADIFDSGIVYIESWGPEYKGVDAVRHWFEEWNTRGRVLEWRIKQFFHKGAETVVEWYFKNKMNSGKNEEFDGMSLIIWNEEGKIKFLKEFGCNLNNYDPYKGGQTPVFIKEKINWF